MRLRPCTIAKFLRTPDGGKFAQDIIEYSKAFRAIVSRDSRVVLSDSDRTFLVKCLFTVEEMMESFAPMIG
ncbi:MAG: hypothetical protein ACTJLK_00815 [Anaplasma sp.]